MRFFNTTAPVVAEDHDCIPPLKRLDLAGIHRLIREKRYFIFHAPRQTGKTSALLALRDLLIVWPQDERTRKAVIECKILHETLVQVANYVDRCDAEAGHLVIFDRREDWQWRDEIFQERRAATSGIKIDGGGM